ncbi:SRPBCC domain-containing protein [Luedemannella helvata]|uniref:SRPBCC family protein n=1 Tax=Luedemannella helvata TaxID=349315 RepID=A0ABN2KT02_9ACTN
MTELVINRIFDAPRELVYRAFVDPDQLAQWFGPVGWSVPRDSVVVEPHPGGRHCYTMVNDADPSQTVTIEATFTDVVPNELLDGAAVAPDGTKMRLRLEFHDEGGKTRLVLRQGPFTEELAEMTRTGWGSSFTKLDDLVAAR